MLIRVFNFFVFSSIYIAICAVMMVLQTNQLLDLHYEVQQYLLFVFFSTICSYNFHWFLTPRLPTEKLRVQWTQSHKTLHLAFFLIGLIGSAIYSLYFLSHIAWMLISVLLTFLYSAPKLPYQPFRLLQKIAVGKTIFLSFVWMYVTTVLPLIFSDKSWQAADYLFCASRFFLIYTICIIFDYRDRENDRKEGIRSLITYFTDLGVKRLFFCCLVIFGIVTALLHYTGMPILLILMLLVPGVITGALYPLATKEFSDYLYYFVLDGLMMLSALLTLFVSF